MRKIQQLPSPPAEDAHAPTQDNVETTRVFVSGLPPKFTSAQLAAYFANGSQYKVTDSHVIADRRIGFVGFQDSQVAQNAAKHFNKSYIRMSKIAVDLARPVEVGNGAPISQKTQGKSDGFVDRKRKRERNDDGERERDAQTKTLQTVGVVDVQDAPKDDTEEVDPNSDAVAATDNDWLRGKTNRTLDLVDSNDVHIMQDDDDDGDNRDEQARADVGGSPEKPQMQAEQQDKDRSAECAIIHAQPGLLGIRERPEAVVRDVRKGTRGKRNCFFFFHIRNMMIS